VLNAAEIEFDKVTVKSACSRGNCFGRTGMIFRKRPARCLAPPALLPHWEVSAMRKATDVQQFFADHKVPEAERTIQQVVERISRCAELVTTQGPKLATWLNK
jgi:hypothetical protein